MKRWLTERGNLKFEYNGIERSHTCPYKDGPCGVWCPLFGLSYDGSRVGLNCGVSGRVFILDRKAPDGE